MQVIVFLKFALKIARILADPRFSCVGAKKRKISGNKKWARQGSNLRPIGYEPTALPLSYEPVYRRGVVSPAETGLLVVNIH